MNAIHVFSFGVIQVFKMIRVSCYVALLFVMSVGVACGPLDPEPTGDGITPVSANSVPAPSPDMEENIGQVTDDMGSETQEDAGGATSFTEATTTTNFTLQEVSLDIEDDVYAIQFSPNGQKMALVTYESSSSTLTLRLSDLDGQNLETVFTSSTEMSLGDVDLKWHPSGNSILYNYEDTLYVVEAMPSRVPKQVSAPGVRVKGFDISSDGSTLVWSEVRGADAYMTKTPFTLGTQISTSTSTDTGQKPCMSPDGSKILYLSYGTRENLAYVATSDFSEQIASFEELPISFFTMADWITNDRIMITVTRGTWIVDLSNHTTEVLPGIPSSYIDVSPNGKKAVYTTQKGFVVLHF